MACEESIEVIRQYLDNNCKMLFITAGMGGGTGTGAAPIATLMRRLLIGYAVSFNQRHRRHGHLFQSRYKSILCQEDPYLLELVRYIHHFLIFL